ncbi:MAG: hypothetical protein Q8R40_01220 [bacterium]|nr:hypothetical protein [bacterium]
MSEDRRKTWEEREWVAVERLHDLTQKVLLYGGILGGTFRVHDLTGGTGLKQQEVLEVLKGMLDAGAAKERHGGKIVHNYPYLYHGPEFEEVGHDRPKVYTIDFVYIEKRRQFNKAVMLLWNIAFKGEEEKRG